MRFSRLIWANIFNRPVRSLLTISGVAVAVGAVVALVGIASGFERSLRDVYESRGVDLIVLQSGKLQQVSSVLPQSIGEELARVEGVDSVAAMLMDVVALGGDNFGVPVLGLSPDEFILQQFKVTSGKRLRSDGRREVLVGHALAEGLKLAVGDPIDVIDGETFTVAGVCESTNVNENGAIIMALADLQELMLREGEVTLFGVHAGKTDPHSIQQLRERITAEDGALAAAGSKLSVSDSQQFAAHSAEMRIAKSLAWLTSTVALIVGAVGILNTMLMAVFERTGELAMMRAVGWRRSRVMSLVLAEAVGMAAAGAVVGSLGGVLITRLLALTPAGARIISGQIAPEVILQGFAVAFVLGVIGGAYPAYRAARMEPIDGLRHD
ncbi:Macrolide export ATP-binding/permease protein MacB [Pirellulimonas nuda]|uniref:Macrolide export ATP-binding/permease protein MacB n=1 Tax=Pirellulimonas nuda TaxID=2528009 RepID=A0A518D5Y3_9BACT|nr:ABC transporter permease [Pirellulimonas nuda]QDU86882.1 Macrolide export ATP-binding/permease protein MacB [Pirellulimonas nuda]